MLTPQQRPGGVNLFPFLSLFLCVMGVLAFLQVLLVAGGQRKIRLRRASGGHGVEFKIYCLDSGFVPVPPGGSLERILHAAPPRWRPRVRAVQLQRARLLGDHGRPAGRRQVARALTRANIRQLLEQVLKVNQAATAARVAYEEFLLFGIYPGGGRCYREVRAMAFEPRYRSITMGAEPLDRHWRLPPGENGRRQ